MKSTGILLLLFAIWILTVRGVVSQGQAYIVGPPSNKTAVLGQRITFSCEARGYPDNITYRWFKDSLDNNVNKLQGYSSGRISILNNIGSLVISIVEKEDMGWYICRPSNGVGLDPEASAFLNVTYKPEVLTNRMFRSVIWALGFNERLDCPVDANPPVSEIVWTKNGKIIDFRVSARVSRLNNGSLIVNRVQHGDAGNFRCTAISSFGTGDSEIVQVEVKDPPRFTLRPENQYLRQLSQSVTMPCAATGTPIPVISWRKSARTVQPDGRIKITGGNLTIDRLIKTDHGVYECEASNEVRKIVFSAELVIQNTTPHAPYNVSVDMSLFSATVRWIPAYSSSAQHYMIWYHSVINGVPSKWQTMAVEPVNTTRFTLYNLEPDTLYEFKVLSRNQLGDGQFSDPVQGKTLGYIHGMPTVLPTDSSGNTYIPSIIRRIGPWPAAPTNVTAVGQGTGILISWLAPTNSTVDIFSYKVEVSSSASWAPAGQNVLVPTTSFVYKPTVEGTTYSFRVFSYGLLAYSMPSNVATYTVPEDDGFMLSETEIGGIIGGLLFLIVAITLAIIAILCSKRRDRRRAKDYDNVKYLGPADDVDARPIIKREYAPEWSDVHANGGRDAIDHHDNDVVSSGGVFMVPRSGDVYRSYNSGYLPRMHDRDHSMYDPHGGRQVPYDVDTSRNTTLRQSYRNSNTGNGDLSSRYNDENGFKDDNGFQTDRTRSSTRSRPSSHHSSGPAHPVPIRPRVYSDHSDDQGSGYPELSFHDNSVRFKPHSFPNIPSRSQQPQPQYPKSQTMPSLSSTAQGRGPPYFGNYGDDEEVFMPPPISSILPERPGFPRHSSMKPGAQQTYLTDNDHPQAFMPIDLSSVLPSPFSDSRAVDPYSPYRSRHPDTTQVPFGSSTVVPGDFDQTGDSFVSDRDNTVVAGQPNRQYSDSSNSSGRPMNYTRDQLQGAVDRIRKGPRIGKRGPGPRGSNSELDSTTESPVPRGYNPPSVSAKPSVLVHDRPMHGQSFGLDPRSVTDNGTSMSSSGLGSNVSRGRPFPGSDPRSYMREDLTPDSLSSGIGSRNTSSQLTGSSLHSRPSRLGSSLAAQEHDISQDSGAPFEYPPHRKDISGDENYEFDSLKAVESDLLQALHNYTEVNGNGNNEELLSALTEGLNTTLYPKPRKQSRYSDSEERFEKLRGEFKQYRQTQLDRQSSSYSQDPRSSSSLSSRGSGSLPRSVDAGSYRRVPQSGSIPNRYSDSSNVSSRASASGPQPQRSSSYYGGMADNSSYRSGPMDSDML